MAQPADEPATADGDHQRVEAVDVVEQLESGRALAGHDPGVVERVHQDHAALGGERVHELLTVLAVALVLHDLGAVALGGGTLERRRVCGHEDDRPGPAQPCGQGDGLGVIAR